MLTNTTNGGCPETRHDRKVIEELIPVGSIDGCVNIFGIRRVCLNKRIILREKVVKQKLTKVGIAPMPSGAENAAKRLNISRQTTLLHGPVL
jgi:hypothetical protein